MQLTVSKPALRFLSLPSLRKLVRTPCGLGGS